MPIIFRAQKGAPLTAEEVDGNFKELLKRIEQLEDIDTPHEALAQIKQEGDELIFQGSLGSELGRAQLPTLRIMPKGNWAAATSYLINDLVQWENTAYLCIKTHSSTNFKADSAYWQKLFEFERLSQKDEKPAIPVVTKDKLESPVFGKLVVMMDQNNIELLIADVGCWRRVRDMQEVKVK